MFQSQIIIKYLHSACFFVLHISILSLVKSPWNQKRFATPVKAWDRSDVHPGGQTLERPWQLWPALSKRNEIYGPKWQLWMSNDVTPFMVYDGLW